MANNKLLRSIPKVDEILNSDELADVTLRFGRKVVCEAVRNAIDEIRNEVLSMENLNFDSNCGDECAILSEVMKRVLEKVEKSDDMNLRKVVNATGVILHTNLGRAPLNSTIKDKVWEIAESYSNLEFDVSTGERGSRYSHVDKLLTSLTGAEAALVVNNNAAAVLLVLGTLAKGKKVVVSRGELVEIGGSFRIPEIMEQSGAELIEVGTTNRTRISDYKEGARQDETGVLLKVHTSNYKIVGFTEEVSLDDMVKLGKDIDIPVIYDLGSGALIDLRKYGIDGETDVVSCVKAGVDVVCFSGDKLLGGPQAGIILGKKDFIEKMKKNPLTRAFRIDKLTLAALEASLRIYLNADDVTKEIPVLSMLTMSDEEINEKAEKLMKLLCDNIKNAEISIDAGLSQTGGGTLPLLEIPTKIITINLENISPEYLEERLRCGRIPVITRINKGKVCIDVRTIKDDDFELIVQAFSDILI